jgi:hypothetical protein
MNFAFFHSAAQKNGEQQQPHTKQNGVCSMAELNFFHLSHSAFVLIFYLA